MVTKFEFDEQELPEDKQELLLAWDRFLNELKTPERQMRVHGIMTRLAMDRYAGVLNRDANLSLLAEQWLTKEYPDVAAATQRFRRALDPFVGRSVSFRFFWPGSHEPEADADLTSGYIFESKVGYDQITVSGLQSFLKIGPDPSTQRGIWYDFDYMQEIRFDVP